MKIIIFTFFIIFALAFAGELPCNCHLGNFNRIEYGKDVKSQSIPWIVSLSDIHGDHFCEATILNENFILTAFNCVEDKDQNKILIRLGLHDTNESGFQKYNFVKQIIHQDSEDDENWALIKLQDPIKFLPGKIEPACLNLDSKNIEGEVFSAGWIINGKSRKNVDDEFGDLGRSLEFYFGSQIDCDDYEISQFNLGTKYNNVCSLFKNQDSNICDENKGGPLMQTKNGKTSIIGLASSISEENEACNWLVSYYRISLYKNLINKHVKNYCTV